MRSHAAWGERGLVVAVGAVVLGLLVSGCGGSGPRLIAAPDPSGGGQLVSAAGGFDKGPASVCQTLGRVVVRHAAKPVASRTTAGDQVRLTKLVTGHTPAPWASLPVAQHLVSCAWLSNNASDLTGLYVVKRGAGLRSGGMYIGTAVIDRSGRWAPDETISFDDYN
jgi:hypothetical protein